MQQKVLVVVALLLVRDRGAVRDPAVNAAVIGLFWFLLRCR